MNGSPGNPGDYEVRIIKMMCPGCREEVEVEVKIRLMIKMAKGGEVLDFEYRAKHGEHGSQQHTLHRLVIW